MIGRFDLAALVLLITIVYFNAIHAPVFAIATYTIPIVPYIAVFVGVTVDEGWRRIRTARKASRPVTLT